MFRQLSAASAILAVLAAAPASAQSQSKTAPSSELDAFMERVLERREIDRKVLSDYILDEKEEFEILGPGRFRLHRTSREYTWIVKEDMHVRSPLRYDGVAVPDEERVRYEENWLRREKRRQERKAKGEKEDAEVEVSSSGVDVSGTAVPTEPRFVSEAYFMDFKFEPGNYYLAGREQFEGQEVVKIEYYPTKLFGGKDDEKTPREMRRDRGQDRERQLENEIERKLNQTSLVTLWVDPKIHQIVKYTFDNVWLDFLPGAWLVRVDSMRASMTMFQPFEGVWLPRGIDISAEVTLANGTFGAIYERRFSDYRQAEVKSRIRIPKTGTLNLTPSAAPAETGTLNFSVSDDPGSKVGGPFVQGNQTAAEKLSVPVSAGSVGSSSPFIEQNQALSEKLSVPVLQAPVAREIRVHGNVAIPDDEVLRIAGVELGMTLESGVAEAVGQRLRDSGRFESVDVRVRLRSLTDPTDAALLLVVHEKPGVIVTRGGDIERPISKRILSRVMFLPILTYQDGYGFTYGARFSTVDLLGAGERLSVPLTWGGTRRAALELERTFDRGPLTRILASTAIWQRENPRFDIDDQRFELKARAERNLAQIVSLGIETTRATVDFGALDDRLWTIGADAAVDTRGNPAYPANALYASAGWTALNVRPGASGSPNDRINRYTLDGRGYLRVFRQIVLAGRARYTNADAPLPPYERPLLGGSETLRGFRAGSFDGDETLVTSAELRVPITDVTSGGKFGMTVFMDAARAADHGARLQDAEWQRGAGAGLFLIASVFRLNLDVARGLDGGKTRLHLSSGFSF
jgi:hypothetical protein